jgi:hypothetical protein
MLALFMKNIFVRLRMFGVIMSKDISVSSSIQQIIAVINEKEDYYGFTRKPVCSQCTQTDEQ